MGSSAYRSSTNGVVAAAAVFALFASAASFTGSVSTGSVSAGPEAAFVPGSTATGVCSCETSETSETSKEQRSVERSSQPIMVPSESVMGSELSASALSGMTQSSNPMVSITTNHLFFMIFYLLLSKIWCILYTINILPPEFWKNKGSERFCTTKKLAFCADWERYRSLSGMCCRNGPENVHPCRKIPETCTNCNK